MKRTLFAALISAMLAIIITVTVFIPSATGHEDVADINRVNTVVDETNGDPAEETAPEADETEQTAPKETEDVTAPVHGGIFYDMLFGSDAGIKNLVLPADIQSDKPVFPTPDYPADAATVSVTVNEVRALGDHTASVDGIIYLPLTEFCALFFDCEDKYTDNGLTVSGEDFEVTAKEGEKYITSRGRVLWCGMGGSVRKFGNVICVPAEPVCRALGLSLSVNENEVSVSGKAVSLSADEVYNADDVYWLSHIISAESRGEPLEGQIAVGCVVLNRMNTFDYLNSVYDVVFDRRYGIQFSPAYSGSVYNEPTESCVRAAKICLEGYTVSDSILYFINSADTPASWMRERCRLVMTIGHHDFYS